MSEHWVYESALVEGYVIKAPESWRYVVDPIDHEGLYGAIYCEADAQLIAAAPELLEALEIALDCAGDAWWAEKAEAAIAKAKGE